MENILTRKRDTLKKFSEENDFQRIWRFVVKYKPYKKIKDVEGFAQGVMAS